MNYLHQRKNGIYYCRFIVPTALQSRIGKKEVWKSLHTSSKAEAKTLLVMAIMAMTKDMDNDSLYFSSGTKNARKGQPIQLTEANIPELVEYYFTNKMRGDELSRLWTSANDAKATMDIVAEAEKSRLESIQLALKYGEYNAGEAITGDLIALLNLTVEKDSHLYKTLCFSVLQAEWKHLNEVRKRNEGNWEGGTYSGKTLKYDSLFNKKSEVQDTKPSNLLTIQSLIDDYNNSPVTLNKSEEMRTKKRVYQSVILELLGADYNILAFKSSEAERFYGLIGKVPKNYTKIYKGKTALEVIEYRKNDSAIEGWSPKTCNDYIDHLAELLNWGESNEKGTKNTLNRIDLRVKDQTLSKDKKDTFTDQDLLKIFSSDGLRKYKDSPTEASNYWIPLIGLCCGMRGAEIAYLQCSDIKMDKDIWYISVMPDEAVGKTVKNAASIRKVPIPDILIQAGFLKYVASKEVGFLFPEATGESKKRKFNKFGKFFIRRLMDLGIKTDKKSFHSLRHTWRDYSLKAAMGAGANDEIFRVMGGWSAGKTIDATTYGRGADMVMKKKVIDSIDFNHLELF